MCKKKTNCIFCQIINNQINSFKIYENKHVLAFLDINAIAFGHTILIPKKHFDNFLQTDDDVLYEIIKAQKIISNHLYKKTNCLGMNYLSNENEIAGQTIFHYHLHLIPKYQKNNGLIFNVDNSNLSSTNIEEIYKKIGKI